jgi:hypothetical protein
VSGTTPSPDTLWGLASSTHTFARRWQHARGLCLESAFLYPGVGNTLRGCSSNRHSFTPGVGNTLGGCASHWYSFALALATRSGAASRIGIHLPRRWRHARGLRLALVFIRHGVGNMLGDCVLQPNASNAWGLRLTLLTLAADEG